MMKEVKSPEKVEQVEQNKGIEHFREIKPKEDITTDECDAFWDDVFQENKEDDNPEDDLETLLKKYLEDLHERSEYAETIPDNPFDVSDLKRRTPEEKRKMREDFDDKKTDLRNQWAQKHGIPWPRHEEDFLLPNGVVIRQKGHRYDAHHIQPLSLGGKNEVDNITPLNASVHFDSRGVHAPDSPYSKLSERLGGDD